MNGFKVHYRIMGQGQPLLILHGWGSSSDHWVKVQEHIAREEMEVVVPDLPGFGKTNCPSVIWGVKDYAEFVAQFAASIGLKKFSLAGHSFGGQVAIQFAVFYPEKIEKLILIAPAAIRRRPGVKNSVLRFAAKIIGIALYVLPPNVGANIKSIGYRLLRRPDYLKSYGIMKDIFKQVISEDLSSVLKDIRVPTLLIWGRRDTLTALEDGVFMSKQIPNAIFKIDDSCGHNFHVQIPEVLAKMTVQFIK